MSKIRIQQKRELINQIRDHFVNLDFFELETPLLVPSPGMETHLHSFKTKYIQHDGSETIYHLPTSPEFSMKKALGNGYGKVFEIARVFRNHGELGSQHHPEFNMLEWYRPGSYMDIMDDVELLLKSLAESFNSLEESKGFSWTSGVQRSTISECFQKHAQLDLLSGLQHVDQWRTEASEVLNEHIPEDDRFEDIFFRVWMKLIEPNLGITRPEIVFDYPASMAALSQLKQPDNIWAERFELYIKGLEIGNAFSELTDSSEQKRRFQEANIDRKKLGYEPHPMDADFIHSVGQMNATGGIAIGVERLLMTLTGEKDIRAFFLYPFKETNLK